MNRNLPFEYHCYGCGAHYPGELLKPQCTACGEPLALTVPTAPDRALFERPAVSQWTYKELLPIARDEHVVSLGEGATPLITAPQLAVKTRFSEITLKLETANPTSSFKDRQVSVGISRARELGMDTVAVVSSGNVACAASAYAARAGMRAILLMHGHAASGKIAQASAYGGKAIRVDDKSAGAVFNLCLAACKEFGWYHLSTAGMYEPFNVEGAKTIAYEVYQQTGGRMPDWIVAPVGGGGLLGGIWRGLLDLQRLGLIDYLPRLAGVQAAGCAPLRQAIDEGLSFLETLDRPWPNPKTIAGGIADDIIFDGHTVLPAIRTTDGVALAVDDEQILAGELALARWEGILCEPSTAVVVPALEQLPCVPEETRVCCIVTGTGIKDLNVLKDHTPEPAVVPPDLDALRRVVEQMP